MKSGTWLIIVINSGKSVSVLTETLFHESKWEIRDIATRTLDFGNVALYKLCGQLHVRPF
jgi:hypothetical protein